MRSLLLILITLLSFPVLAQEVEPGTRFGVKTENDPTAVCEVGETSIKLRSTFSMRWTRIGLSEFDAGVPGSDDITYSNYIYDVECTRRILHKHIHTKYSKWVCRGAYGTIKQLPYTRIDTIEFEPEDFNVETKTDTLAVVTIFYSKTIVIDTSRAPSFTVVENGRDKYGKASIICGKPL